uniref:Uncharacterized protein n=1 Tax=Cyclopterus lumpus TaxID=8103 RepID=A0A8C2XA94_CYCLU
MKGEMAQRGDELARKKLCCFICRDLMKDPVLIPCGHSYCMGCIKKHWDEEDQKGIHSCPQCRKTFRPRPTLVKNTMLADLVEELRKPRLPVALADPCYAGPEDVGCDVCTGRKRKALKSGLQCRVSYLEASEEISAELIRVITKRSSAVTRKIRSQQETEMSRDPTQFLLKYASMPRPTSSPALPNLNRRPLRHFDHVTASVSEAGEKLKASYREEWNKVSETVAEVDILLPQDPKTRAEFLQYAQPVKNLKMDRNTASIQLVLSEGDRKVTKIRDPQSYADHADRFMSRSQALCKTGLTGRHYWEVEWSGLGVSIAVAYRDIARTGNISTFGDNVKSWALECLVKDTQIFPQNPPVGVFLDHKAGNLSFYRISDTITLLHKVQTKFSQPLYAGLGVYYFGSMAELCDAKSQSGGFPRETAAV